MRAMTESAAVINLKSSARPMADREKPQLVKFYILGDMRILVPGGGNILPRARKSRAILAILCLAGGKPVSRSRLIALLWDRSGDVQARMSLRHALSELNSLINGRVPNLIEIDRESVRLNTQLCWIDAFAAPDHAERLLADLDGISPAFDHWLAGERARFEDQQRATSRRISSAWRRRTRRRSSWPRPPAS